LIEQYGSDNQEAWCLRLLCLNFSELSHWFTRLQQNLMVHNSSRGGLMVVLSFEVNAGKENTHSLGSGFAASLGMSMMT
jgi:hypothetical protein